ncbi:hypothetical protein ACVUA4_001376 [Escherichia coli]
MLTVNAARISNVITFTTDFKSLQKAKNEVDKLQKKMQGIKPVQVAAARQKELQKLGKEIQRQHDQNVKQAVKSETQAAKASTKQKLQEAKNLAKAQAKQASIAEKAEIKRLASYRQLQGIKNNSRYGEGMDIKKYHDALRYIKQQTAEFEKGNISQAKMNALIRDRITLERRAAAAATRRNAAAGGVYPAAAKKIRKEGVSGGGALMMGGVGGIIGGAAVGLGSMAVSAGAEKARERMELQKMSDLVGADSNQVAAMLNWGRANGVDSASADKITDNIKDLNERIGHQSRTAEWDSKKKEWRGGEGSLNDIQNTFAWNKDKIASYQGRPLQLLQDVVREGERRGMTKEAIISLIEPLADDASHYIKMFSRDGEGFRKTMVDMEANGQLLTEAQKEQYRAANKTATAFDRLTDGLSNQAILGFFDGIANMPALKPEESKALQNAAYGVGASFGDLAKQGAVLLTSMAAYSNEITGWINKHLSRGENDTRPETQKVMDAATDGEWSPATIINEGIRYATGLDTKDVGRLYRGEDTNSGVPGWWTDLTKGNANSYGSTIVANKQQMYEPNVSLQRQYANAAPVNVNAQVTVPSDMIAVNVIPNGPGFTDLIRTEIKANNNQFSSNLILSTLSGQSSGN